MTFNCNFGVLGGKNWQFHLCTKKGHEYFHNIVYIFMKMKNAVENWKHLEVL